VSGLIYLTEDGLRQTQPEFCLLDLGLPDMDGLDLLRQVRADFGGSILILSARLRVLRRRQQGREPVQALFVIGDLVVDLQAYTVVRAGQAIHLTPIEFTLLSTLIQAKGQLLTHRKLLQAVWDAEAVEQTHYLRIYMGKLRAKIEPIPAEPTVLLTETGVGYRICGLQ